MTPALTGLSGLGTSSGLTVVQDFVSAAADIDSMASLRALLDGVVRELGFDYYALTHHVRFGHPSVGHVRLSNYPLEWLAKIREDDSQVDPVLRAAERTSSGFRWDQLERLVPCTAKDRMRMEQANRHGLAQGFTVPNHVPGEAFGSCHFAIRPDRPFPELNVSAAQALGNFAFEAARRLLAERVIQSDEYVIPAPLSDRQRECLLFVARGKSDNVIAQLLDIRPRTVNEHIEAAKRRYSVASRAQLLVRALFRSEICFTEVLE